MPLVFHRVACSAIRRSAATAVRTGDDLQPMPVRTLPIEAATPVPVVDLVRLTLEGVGPPRAAVTSQATENEVELLLTHEERVVLAVDLALAVHEVQARGVVQL